MSISLTRRYWITIIISIILAAGIVAVSFFWQDQQTRSWTTAISGALTMAVFVTFIIGFKIPPKRANHVFQYWMVLYPLGLSLVLLYVSYGFDEIAKADPNFHNTLGGDFRVGLWFSVLSSIGAFFTMYVTDKKIFEIEKQLDKLISVPPKKNNEDVSSILNIIRDDLLKQQLTDSLNIDLPKAVKSHDSVNELKSLAGILVPTKSDAYHKHTAYIIYHWEIVDIAHRSYLEAISAFYNAAFVLLRSTLELLINGIFFDCLSHEKYRNNSQRLDDDNKGIKIKSFLVRRIKADERLSETLEETSAAIFDKISTYVSHRENIPSVSTMLKQIIDWKIFEGIDQPYEKIYSMYQELSLDVHGRPDNTDIGRTLVSDLPIFQNKEVMKEHLIKHFDTLHSLMDIAMVATLNIFKDYIKDPKVNEDLRMLLNNPSFQTLHLNYTENRIVELLGEK